MAYRSNASAVINAITQGADDGLTVAAEFYTRRVRMRLLRGYKSGNFSNGESGVAGRVMFGKPYAIPGGRAINTGTSTTQVPYELYWELGHQNVFTRRYERNEVWREEGEAAAPTMERMIARNMRARLDAAGFQKVATPNVRVGVGRPTVQTR